MAPVPDSPISARPPSMKRKLSDRDEIVQKWRLDLNFRADADYRNKCTTKLPNDSDNEEVIIEPSHPPKIPGNTVNKKFKKSSCADEALKLIIQECIGRIDKIDRDFEKYKRSSFEKTAEISREEKSCCKCSCAQKENQIKTKEQIETSAIAPDSGTEIKDIASSHPEIVEDPSNNFSINGSSTVPSALPNFSSQNSLVETAEMSPQKESDTCISSLGTNQSIEKVSNESTKNSKSERTEISPKEDHLSCNMPSVTDLSSSTQISKDDLSCNTPVTNKIKADTTRSKSKSKEFWFEASLQNFENSPNVQRGRPSIHVLKDRRIVQSLAKQFS